MASYQVLNSVITNKKRPIVGRFPGINPGTLLRVDPSLVSGDFTGVPDNGAYLPNAASVQAAALLGIADDNSLKPAISAARDGENAFSVARTPKGGLELLPSQVNQTSNSNYFVIRYPTALRQAIFDLLPGDGSPSSHGFAISIMWAKIRSGSEGSGAPQSNSHIESSALGVTDRSYFAQSAGQGSMVGASVGSYISPGAGAFGVPALTMIGFNTWTGTKPGAATGLLAALFGVGNFDGWVSSANRNKNHGYVVYNIQLDDLYYNRLANDGEGGTFAEEFLAHRNQRLEEFNKAFAASGKYAGDTIINPATFP